MKHRIRRLVDGEEAALDAFLSVHIDSSMFLRSNLRRAGFVDRGAPHQATYCAAFDRGAIIGVAGHCLNGMLLVEAPELVESLAPAVVAASGRGVFGLSGPGGQVARAHRALGLETAATTEDRVDDLFSLDLGVMKIPAGVTGCRVTVRHPNAGEIDLMAEGVRVVSLRSARLCRWACVAAQLRGSSAPPSGGRRAVRPRSGGRTGRLRRVQRGLARHGAVGRSLDAAAVAWARLRAGVVAGALLAAREAGAKRAVLFTDSVNWASRSAYRSQGFAKIGDCGLVIFAEFGRL